MPLLPDLAAVAPVVIFGLGVYLLQEGVLRPRQAARERAEATIERAAEEAWAEHSARVHAIEQREAEEARREAEIKRKENLKVAVEVGDLKEVQSLIQTRVNGMTKVPSDDLNILLLDATERGHCDLVEYLLQAGADVHAQAAQCSALLAAAKGGHEKTVEVLLKYGANVNARMKSGRRAPLHVAVEGGHEKAVQILLSFGADVHALDLDGSTVLELAEKRGQWAVVPMLREPGAHPVLGITESMPYHHIWTMEWQAREYLETEFDPKEDVITNLLVLDEDYDASIVGTTLRNILLSSGASAEVIDDIIRSLLSITREPSETQHALRSSFSPTVDLAFRLLKAQAGLRDTTETILVEARARTLLTIECIETVLVSLCCILRPPGGHISRSEAQVQLLRIGRSTIVLEPLEELKVKSCWTPLFNQKVVARVLFRRHQFKSLVPSFGGVTPAGMLRTELSWLQELAGADTPIYMSNDAQDDGGLCISGPYSLLIPKERLHSRSGKVAIMWHLLRVEKVTDKGPRSRRNLLQHFQDWAKVNNWEQIKHYEHFLEADFHYLGWTSLARITLGTREQNYILHRTQASTVHQEVLEHTINFGLGLGYGGPSTTFGGSFKIGRGERSNHMDKDRELTELLDRSNKEYVLLWNPNTLQAWMVPDISVVLHMTIAYFRDQARRHQDIDELPEDLQVLYGADNPFQVLSASFNRRTVLGGEHCLKDVVKSMLYMLGQMYIANLPVGNSRCFKGFEAYDLLHQPRNYRVKEADASRHFLSQGKAAGWHKLLPEMSAVLFSEDLLDVIVADRHAPNVDTGFNRLPGASCYLAMTVSGLLELLSKYDESDESKGQLAEGAYWHCQYFLGHRIDTNVPREDCDRLQIVAKAPNRAGIPMERLRRNARAAVVFRANSGFVERVLGYIYG